MDGREVAAAIIGVVFLLTMVGKRLAGNLAARNTAAVGENSKKQRIDGGALLEDVQYLFNTLVQERDGAHLNTHHPRRYRLRESLPGRPDERPGPGRASGVAPNQL